MKLHLALAVVLLGSAPVWSNPPAASYIFPPGGQRGQTVAVRVGGLFLHQSCGFEMLGPGTKATSPLKRIPTIWFEGPLLPLPASQQAEDYPKDMAGQVAIAKDAPLGMRHWRLWTSQGCTPAMKFVVGDLPEVVEEEIDGDPVAVPVTLPVTINGRIFPREDVDLWAVKAKKGQTVRCEVHAARLGSPLDARLEILDSRGRRIAENEDAFGPDPVVRFTAPEDGEYQVRIQDTRSQGGQAFVYRLTITAEPYVDSFFPLGGRRGSKVSLNLLGQAVPSSVAVTLPEKSTQYSILSTGHLVYPLHLDLGAKKTNAILLDADDLPEYLESQDGPGRANPLALPAVCNGRIAKPGEIDSWTWAGKKGDRFEFDLRAGRLGSPLDGVIRLLDSAGKELARAEAGPGQIDPILNFTVPADGNYTVQVQDRFRSRGGPTFAYRLRVDRPAPADFRLWLAVDAVTVPRKGEAKLKILADRLSGFKEPITLTVTGLPPGVTLAGTTLAAGQTAVDLTLKADNTARILSSRLTIQGTATIAGLSATRSPKLKAPRGERELDSVLLAVALPTPFQIKGEYDMGFAPRGTIHKRKYKIERGGFDGPIEVSLTDRQARHLQGVTGPTIIIPAGVNDFTYAATLPPWMETGRTSRTCVMGVGVIKDSDGSEHRVSFSSVNQNEQLVAVVGPGKLGLELERTSLTLRPGQEVSLPVRIQRAQGLHGPVQLELIVPAHIRGLKAAPARIAAGQDRGLLPIQAQAKLAGPFNMPLIVRATLMHQGQPVFAEAMIEVHPEP